MSIRFSAMVRPSVDFLSVSLRNDQQPSAGETLDSLLSTPFSSSRETAFEQHATVVDSNYVCSHEQTATGLPL